MLEKADHLRHRLLLELCELLEPARGDTLPPLKTPPLLTYLRWLRKKLLMLS